MKPRKLRIAGLNSFVEEQVIDFEKLTAKGLFGIFGPTGSGKSTILDAITIAMYGEIPRGTSEYINSQCDEVFISYEFEIGASKERCVYIIDRHIKRDKAGTGYITKSAVLRQVIDGETKVLCDKARDIKNSIISIIGLNCDDFTRSVVLPQGKFSEFLRLKGSERREMLERIFNLRKYGTELTKKIREVKRKYQSELDKITGSIERYGDVSQELCSQKELELEELKKLEKQLMDKKQELDRDFERAKKLWELQKELDLYAQKLNSLELKRDEMDEKQNRFICAGNALSVKPFIDDLMNTQKKTDESKARLKVLDGKLEEGKKLLDETQSLYSKAYDRKENELKQLVQKEANLNIVIDMDNEIKKMMLEIEELLEKHKSLKGAIKQYETDILSLEEKRKTSYGELYAVEEELNKVKVVPEYREKIIKAADVQKEYLKLEQDKKRLDSRVCDIKKLIDTGSSEYTKLLKKLEQTEQRLQQLEDQKTKLSSECPGDSNMLLKQQSELQKLETSIAVYIEDKQKCEGISKELCEIMGKIREYETENIRLTKMLNENTDVYNQLVKKIEDIENTSIAGMLAERLNEGEPCPVCGSVHHPIPAVRIEEQTIVSLRQQRDKTKETLDELSKMLGSVGIELGICNSNAALKIKEISQLEQKHSDISIEQMEKNRDLLRSEFSKLKSMIADWERQLEQTQEKISDAKDEKSRDEALAASLNAQVVKDKLQLDEVNNELLKCSEDYKNICSKYDEYKVDTGITNFIEELKLINENTRKEDNLRKRQSELISAIKLVEDEAKKLGDEMSSKKLELAAIEENGRLKRSEIQKRQQERNKYYDMENPSEYLSQVQQLIKDIQNNEAELKKKLEKQTQVFNEIIQIRAMEEEGIKRLQQLCSEQKERLDRMLAQNGFENLNEALAALLDENTVTSLKMELEEYKHEFDGVKDNIIRIESILSGDSIKEEAYVAIISSKNETDERFQEQTRLIAAKESDLKRMQNDLEQVKELLKVQKDTKHTLDILSDLDSVTGASRFVEFISTNQLKYIAIEASRRLSDITHGRYALELDSNGEFVMRDDYTGGMRRSVDTLSGGETFLTSLSLALALSSHIQLKGKAPLEFFFLDEGFGTLDSELLETVMSSLEKLHSDRLCVGIISHVDEIKNRVPVKLIVTPAVPGVGGTKVEIEYS